MEVGLLADKVLRRPAVGQVAAVFERSLYAKLDKDWLCVGQRDIGSGPMHVLCDEPWRRRSVGDAVRIADGILWVAGVPFVRLASASLWEPAAPPRWSANSLSCGLHAVNEIWKDAWSDGGLAVAGSEHLPIEASPLVRAAMPGLSALKRIVSGEGVDGSGLESLIGLGPGLTPSGDDLIGGALIALAALDRADRRDVLWNCLVGQLGRTNAISQMHLRAAAIGYGAAALHAALHATMSGQSARIHSLHAALKAVGHTSGTDAFAGCLIVLRLTECRQ